MNNQEFITKFESEYNETVIYGKFEHDANIPYQNNTAAYNCNEITETFASLVDDEDFILFAFDKNGETIVQFQFDSTEMKIESLITLIKSLTTSR